MQELLKLEIYTFLFVFLRIGAAFSCMPGFATAYVNTRIRLCCALLISVVVAAFLTDKIPSMPKTNSQFVLLMLFEVTYGVFIGLTMQFLFSALSLVGNFAGQAIGFANAQMFDPTSLNQSIIVESFLSILAITVIFITNLHHLMISALVDSYTLLPPAEALPINDFAMFLAETLNNSFITGFKVASPFIAFSLVFYTGIGLVSRLMPQLNIFFLSLPLQIYLGLGLFLITIPVMILWFIKYYEEGLMTFIKN